MDNLYFLFRWARETSRATVLRGSRLSLSLCFLLVLLPRLYAQPPLTGRVLEELGDPLPGAYVSLRSGPDSTVAISDADGRFALDPRPPGRYELTIRYIGYETLTQELRIEASTRDLGTFRLRESALNLGEVEVRERMLPAQQKGDTTEFNAGAYKTLPDADAQDLIGKLPTVDVSNGKVQAQGEDVRRVLVDGRPFFGDDPNAALRNLPAEVIQKIQIYDQQSDQSQFTGIEDGETSKTINIITKPDRRSGQFGKIYAGYGTDDRYQAGGNINAFNGEQRWSFIGQANNVNQQNFATEDLLGVVGDTGGGGRRGRGRRGGGGASVNDFLVPAQGGITGTQALGLNYNDKWGEKLEFNGSYFFNRSDNATLQSLNQLFIDQDETDDTYDETSRSESENYNHRLNGRIEYALNDQHSFIFRPRASWQLNDGLSQTFGANRTDGRLLSSTDNQFAADLSALDLSGNLLWRYRLGKRRRTLSVNLSGGSAPQAGENQLRSANLFPDRPARSDTLDQLSNLDQNSWNFGTDVTYTEPVGERGALSVSYRLNYQQEDRDRRTFDYDPLGADYDLLNEPLSNVFANDFVRHNVGGGYTYFNEGLVIMGRAFVQSAQLTTEQTFPDRVDGQRTFVNLLPMAMVRYRLDQSVNLRLFYRSNADLPNIGQLQNVLDNRNPLQLSIGNPGLIQAVDHRVGLRYSRTNTERSSVLFALLSASFTQDRIANARYLGGEEPLTVAGITLAPGEQLTRPVNLDGYYNLRGLLTYGFPVGFLKSNLNLDFNLAYTRTPGLINDVDNFSGTSTPGLGLTLSSNVSERLDFSLASRTNYNYTTNSLEDQANNDYWQQQTQLRINWLFGPGFVLRTEAAHQLYAGLSGDFDQQFLLWNLSLGKKLFTQDRGELSLVIFDLLNQNNNLGRIITETYIQDSETQALTQYFLLVFKYDLRHFGTPPARPSPRNQRRSWRE
jgi:hypothetical protein